MRAGWILAAAVLPVGAAAQTLLYRVGFETSQGYQPGFVEGVSSWRAAGPGAGAGGLVVDSQRSEGTQSLMLEAWPVADRGWWGANYSFNPAASSSKVFRVTVDVRPDPGVGASAQWGLDLVRSDGTRVAGWTVARDGSVQLERGGGLFAAAADRAPDAGRWTTVGLTVDLANGTGEVDVDGAPAAAGPIGISAVAMIDFAVAGAAGDRVYWDRMEVRRYAAGSLHGRPTLGGHVGALGDRTIRLALRTPGQTAELEGWNLVRASDGTFTTTTARRGTFDLAFTSRGYLRRVLRGVEIGPRGVFTLNPVLIPGDIDGDNAVTVFDYDKLSVYFDREASGAGWTTPDADGVAPRDADLDGDGAVTVFDYDLLSAHFDAVGDD